MPTVHILGKVLPEVAQVSIGHKPIIKWESPDIDLTMEFTNHIDKSQIDVECKLNRYDPNDFTHLYIRALDLTRASVDLIAFATGWCLTVVLDTFVDPDGQRSPIAPKDDSLRSLCTAFDLTNGFDDGARSLSRAPRRQTLRRHETKGRATPRRRRRAGPRRARPLTLSRCRLLQESFTSLLISTES